MTSTKKSWEYQKIYLAQFLFIIAPSFILYGYNQAVVSTLLDTPDMVHYLPQIDTIHTHGATKNDHSTLKGLVNACFQLGALVGSLSCARFGDMLGRRKAIFVASIFTTIGQILQCTTFSLPQFVVGRLILGMGVGQLSVTVPFWQAESSAAANRGRRVITAGIAMCVGFLMSSWIDLGCSKFSYEPLQWRIPLAIPTLFAIVISLSIFYLPESPRWLIQKNRLDEARETLAKLNGLPIDDNYIQREITFVQTAFNTSGPASIKDIFSYKNKESRLQYRLLLCLTLQTLQQLVGGNLVSFYTTTIFQTNLHLQGDLPSILAGSSLTWKFFCSFISFFAVDRLGRRPIFVISGGGMCVCMIIMAGTTSLSSNHAASIVSGVFVFIFNFFYPIGFLGGNFVYCSEIAPVRLRIAMTSISTANHWLWSFIITMVSPVALSDIGWKYYIVFACVNACVPLIILLFFPETMGRNLEAIDRVFVEAPTIWSIVPMVRGLPQENMSGSPVPIDDKQEMTVAHEEEFV